MKKADYVGVEKHIFNRLKKLQSNLDYHGINHTKDVVDAAERIGKMEKISEKGMIIVKTAALFHDVGFLKKYKNNEAIGAKMAKQILPKFNYKKNEISAISKIILATTLPQKPKTIYGKIVCDADLDNLGRSDFFERSEDVRMEFYSHGNKIPKKEWYERALKLLQGHKYWTKSARKLRNKKKKENIKKIKNILSD